ncbi:MAG: biotin--[acetyl-CoA-carboxylase] ligase [Hyphomicrobiaceae bacterium]|nr:biotin--[acetyl-CoA-carboxylase] ligase [Hyphomicrobiaceae bacterium]
MAGERGLDGACWIELDEIDSTNAELMRRAIAGERRPLYVRASRQTAGRGRSGRMWHSPPGNIAMSRLVPLDCPPAAVPQISLVTGLAVHRAVAEQLDASGISVSISLKWPNDLLAGRAKLAGVLVEATTAGADRIAVVGIGINVAHAPRVEGRETVALASLGLARADDPATPAALARRVGAHLDRALDEWDSGQGFASIREAWLDRSLPLGTEMSVDTGPGGRVAGTFAGLDDAGYLLMERAGAGRMVVTVGDVALLSD